MCVKYRGLNQLIIKNWYPLSLISKLLDQLNHAKVYTKIDVRLLFFNIWWTMSFMSIWMISWSVTSMTSSFSQRTRKTMTAMYIWFWRSFRRLDFTPNWNSVNSINLKWNSWVISALEMAFTWTFTRFIRLLIGFL